MRVWTYILLLPEEENRLLRFLRSVFGSEAAVEIIKKIPVDGGVYQTSLIKELSHSNKTIIKALQNLVELRILNERMVKVKRGNRTVWVKFYTPTDLGRWLIMLLSPVKRENKVFMEKLIKSLFRLYVGNVFRMCKKHGIDPNILKAIVEEELAAET